MTTVRGRIRRDCWVSCGSCGSSEFVDTELSTAKAEATRMGWKYTYKSGWLCPECTLKPRPKDGEPIRMESE